MDDERPIEALREHGLLLVADNVLPSLATLVAGGPIRGSWWGHPKGHAIFRAAEALSDHPEALVVRLVSGKVTFVHRRLWPALLRAACALEPWQTRGLSKAARALLEHVTAEGRVQGRGEPARELERRLLVFGEQVHTESGAHATRLETWERWARRAGVAQARTSAGRARKELEDALVALNTRFGGRARLPWAFSASAAGSSRSGS